MEANRELLRAKYGKEVNSAKNLEKEKKAEAERQKRLKQQRLQELARTKKLEEERLRKMAEFKRNNQPKPEPPPKTGMGRKKNIEGRRLSYYMEERKPKVSCNTFRLEWYHLTSYP